MNSAILTPKRTEYGKAIRKQYESGLIKESRHNMTELEPRTDGISNTLTTVQKNNMVLEKSVTTAGKDIASTIRSSIHKQGERNILQNVENGLGYEGVIEPTYRIRKLTEKECWRLMSFSDRDFEKAAEVNSRSQLYRQAGNSICLNCLIAIFSQLGIKGVQKWNDGLKDKYK